MSLIRYNFLHKSENTLKILLSTYVPPGVTPFRDYDQTKYFHYIIS
jgi:hypothetical protein